MRATSSARIPSATIELLGDTDVVATIAEGGAMTLRKPFFLLEQE